MYDVDDAHHARRSERRKGAVLVGAEIQQRRHESWLEFPRQRTDERAAAAAAAAAAASTGLQHATTGIAVQRHGVGRRPEATTATTPADGHGARAGSQQLHAGLQQCLATV